MATTQEFIDALIEIINGAEEAGSVTNEMVARVLDYLNRGYKDFVQYSSQVALELNERVAAETALRRTIDTLISENTTATIDNFNEIIYFLNGFKDDENLANIILGLRHEIDNSNAAIGASEGRVMQQIQNLSTTTGQQLARLTAIRLSSEEEHARMVANGTIVPGQVYYTVEED